MAKARDPKVVKGIIRKNFNKWSWIIKWLGWHFSFEFHDKVSDMPEGTANNVAMRIFADWQYLHAHIHVCMENCLDQTDDDIEYYVIHELTHMLLDPMSEKENYSRLEYTTTSLARVIHNTYKRAKAEKVPEKVVK